MLITIILAIFYLIVCLLMIFKPQSLLYLLLALVPFHPFIKTVLLKTEGLSSIEIFLISSWKEIIILLIILSAVATYFKNRDRIKLIWTDYLIIGLIFWAVVSLFFNDLRLTNLLFGIKYSFGFLLLYLSVKILKLKKNQLTIAVKIFIAAGLVVALLTLIQYFFISDQTLINLGYHNIGSWQPEKGLDVFQSVSGQKRAFGPMSGPNQLGTYLSLTAIIALGLLVFNGIKKNRPGLLLTLSLSLPALYFSFSRSAWLIFALAAISLVIIKAKKRWSFGRAISIAALAAVLVVLTIIPNWQTLIRHTDQDRLQRLSQSFQIFLDNPLGVGIGQTGPAAQWLNSAGRAVISENYYLQIGLELGLIGLIAFLIIIANIIRQLGRRIGQQKDRFQKSFQISSLIGFIAVLISGLFLHSLADSALAYSLAIIIGLADNISINRLKNVEG